MRFKIVKDDHELWMKCKGNEDLFHQQLKIQLQKDAKIGCAKAGIPWKKRYSQYFMLIPMVNSDGKRDKPSSSTTDNRTRELEIIRTYKPNASHVSRFVDMLHDHGGITLDALIVLVEIWGTMNAELVNTSKVTPISLMELVYYTGPGHLMKRGFHSERYEACRCDVADEEEFNSNTGGSCKWDPTALNLSQPSVEDPVTPKVTEPIDEESLGWFSDKRFKEEVSSGKVCVGGVRTLNGASEQSTINKVVRDYYSHQIKSHEVQGLLSTLFDETSMHYLKVYQLYQGLLHRLIVLICEEWKDRKVPTENSKVVLNMRTACDTFSKTPLDLLAQPCTICDLYAFLISSNTTTECLGTYALLSLIHSGFSTGHSDIFQKHGDLLISHYEMTQFGTFFSGIIEQIEVINGFSKARKLKHSESTNDLYISVSTSKSLILSIIEKCISNFRGSSQFTNNCSALLGVWRSACSDFDTYSDARSMIDAMSDSLQHTMFTPVDDGSNASVMSAVTTVNTYQAPDELVMDYLKSAKLTDLVFSKDNKVYFKVEPDRPSVLKRIPNEQYRMLGSSSTPLVRAFTKVRKQSFIFHNIQPAPKSSIGSKNPSHNPDKSNDWKKGKKRKNQPVEDSVTGEKQQKVIKHHEKLIGNLNSQITMMQQRLDAVNGASQQRTGGETVDKPSSN